jgi:hypothetical protein
MSRRVGWLGLIVCGLVSTMLGCGKGTDDAGAGGTSNGGASGASGASAGGGSAGASLPIEETCRGGVTTPPLSALLTDFSDAAPDPAHAGDYRFGGLDASRVQGSTVRFSNTPSDKGTLSLSAGKLGFSTTVTAPTAAGPGEFPYSGFALVIDGPACVDASAYTGISFELEGDLGECILYLSFAYADDLATSADPNRGLCSGTCYPSEFAITTDTTSVSFADAQTVPGVPVAPINTPKLVGVQWQVVSTGTTSCAAAFTVAKVRFE